MSNRLYSGACERNREPILDVLRRELPKSGLILEIASGTGMHAAWFAPRLPNNTWQPSDQDEAAIASIEAWRVETDAKNFLEPIRLDVLEEKWPIDSAAGIFNANMSHISPFECTIGLLAGAARTLASGATLILYGPYKEQEVETAASNVRFDDSLRARDPRWGIRQLDNVQQLATDRGLDLRRRVAMPSNNLCLVFVRT